MFYVTHKNWAARPAVQASSEALMEAIPGTDPIFPLDCFPIKVLPWSFCENVQEFLCHRPTKTPSIGGKIHVPHLWRKALRRDFRAATSIFLSSSVGRPSGTNSFERKFMCYTGQIAPKLIGQCEAVAQVSTATGDPSGTIPGSLPPEPPEPLQY